MKTSVKSDFLGMSELNDSATKNKRNDSKAYSPEAVIDFIEKNPERCNKLIDKNLKSLLNNKGLK